MDVHYVVFCYSGIVCLFVSSWLPRLLNDVQLMHHFLKTFLLSQKKILLLETRAAYKFVGPVYMQLQKTIYRQMDLML